MKIGSPVLAIQSFFYKHMNFLAEAFAKHILCLFFKTKAFMCYVLNFFEKKAFMCLIGHVLIKKWVYPYSSAVAIYANDLIKVLPKPLKNFTNSPQSVHPPPLYIFLLKKMFVNFFHAIFIIYNILLLENFSCNTLKI